MELATKAHTVDALQAVGIDRAWLIPPVTPGADRIVIAAVQPQPLAMADTHDAYDQLSSLEWVLQEVYGMPVTVRLYFWEEAVPRSAVPIVRGGPGAASLSGLR
jgi:hypothetical protein